MEDPSGNLIELFEFKARSRKVCGGSVDVELPADIGPLLFEPNPYKGVRSIETSIEYQNLNLLRRAWALPGARAYRRGGFEYQSNSSFCGPASIANVLRSVGKQTNQAFFPPRGALIQ